MIYIYNKNDLSNLKYNELILSQDLINDNAFFLLKKYTKDSLNNKLDTEFKTAGLVIDNKIIFIFLVKINENVYKYVLNLSDDEEIKLFTKIINDDIDIIINFDDYAIQCKINIKNNIKENLLYSLNQTLEQYNKQKWTSEEYDNILNDLESKFSELQLWNMINY